MHLPTQITGQTQSTYQHSVHHQYKVDNALIINRCTSRRGSVSITWVQLNSLNKMRDWNGKNIKTGDAESEREPKEGCIIPLTDAGPKPHTVVVKVSHTVITYVAMRRLNWTED